MKSYHIFSFICFIIGVSFFIFEIISGEAEGGIFIVFPFIVGSGLFPLLGFICIFIAIIFFSFGIMKKNIDYKSDLDFNGSSKLKRKELKGGGIVLIGPIPIVFGSNWKITLILIFLAVILILVSIFYFRFL